MGELERIERVYGCVAEYNRVMWEEEQEYYEPTEQEQYESNKEYFIFKTKREYLSGKPSDLIISLKKKWEESKPVQEGNSYTSSYAYDIRKWNTAMKLDIIDKLCTEYGVSYDEEWSTFYRTPDKTFAISVEYCEFCEIHHIHIGNLDYPTFQKLFRDLYEISYPTMNYRVDDKSNTLSNISLGELKIYDLKMWGVETEESLNKALEEAGYNEEETINKFNESWRA